MFFIFYYFILLFKIILWIYIIFTSICLVGAINDASRKVVSLNLSNFIV